MLLVFSRLAIRPQLRRSPLLLQTSANRRITALRMLPREDDAVYDSEPERERAREERRRERRAKRAEERAKQKPEVIDIPSDDDIHASVPGNNAGPSIVITAGTPSSSSIPRPLPKPFQRLSVDTQDAQQSLAPIATLAGQQSSSALPSAAPSDEEQEDEPAESQCRLPIAHLAYTGAPSRTTSRSIPSRQPSAQSSTSARPPTSAQPSSSTTAPKPKAKGAKKPPTHRFAADFTDEDLAKFTTCICCKTAWTVRKSGTQKMLHVQTCAKKHGFADDLVRKLVRQQIDAAPEGSGSGGAKGKGKGKAKEMPPPEPETLLENLVNENAPKKKGRRAKDAEQVETVKKAADTHDAIKDRARTLFGLGEPQPPTQAPPAATQAFQPSRLAPVRRMHGLLDYEGEPEDAAPPATQAFQPSKLGARKVTLLDYDANDAPPPTQSVQPSKLGARKGGLLDYDAADAELPPTQEYAAPASSAEAFTTAGMSNLSGPSTSPERSILSDSANRPATPRTTARNDSPASAHAVPPSVAGPRNSPGSPQRSSPCSPQRSRRSSPRLRRTGSSGSSSNALRVDEVIEIDDDDDNDDHLPKPIAFDEPIALSDPWDSDEGILVVDMSTRDPTPITSPEYSPLASPRLGSHATTGDKQPLGTYHDSMDIDDRPMDIDDRPMAMDDPWDDHEAYLHVEPAASYTTPVHTPPSSPESLPEMSPVRLGNFSALRPGKFSPRKRSPSTSSTSSIPLAISTRSAKKTPSTPKRKATSPPGDTASPSKRASPSKPSSSRASPTKPSTPPPKKPSKPRTKAPKPPKEPEPTFDDAWAARIRGLITADRALHFRILRYEPISFDVFTHLTAHEPGASSGKFKFHLRALLDKLAINFYGAEGITWKPTKK
ncbi:uncharacterized protein SCHCODRAFT_02538453 [Schizophyllum commune H4-8]|nr:uncharacterized protein SCHCODRAFT_02538453 [Schizophyllum commune H4-8]KAI5893426.1 hypothetical protein SCHCODRAFT_02538453 [Schizophyllum commune H4-8]